MSIAIQFCMKDYVDSDKGHIQKCPECGEGNLHYPSVQSSDIGGNMQPFRATCHCTQCNDYISRNNTAPRYLTWRVVVAV